ncbi:hypothetical protein LCGC14_2683800 [marine sediment metagenome]|uniref:Uncharacterized protein n=1 Tax=marine sediment metagenome TaxID=412755 RepID=A0A0F8ZKJ2_9ZZZZ
MNVYEALKNKDYGLRLSAVYKWLVWSEGPDEWVVYQKEPYQRHTSCLYRGDSCDEAVAVLVREE